MKFSSSQFMLSPNYKYRCKEPYQVQQSCTSVRSLTLVKSREELNFYHMTSQGVQDGQASSTESGTRWHSSLEQSNSSIHQSEAKIIQQQLSPNKPQELYTWKNVGGVLYRVDIAGGRHPCCESNKYPCTTKTNSAGKQNKYFMNNSLGEPQGSDYRDEINFNLSKIKHVSKCSWYRPVQKVNVVTGEIAGTYNSVKSAAQSANVGSRHICSWIASGAVKSGHKYQYVDISNAIPGEQWRTCTNYPNYQVSSLGRAQNKHTKRILKLQKINNGYYICTAMYSKQVVLSRLVAMEFVPLPPGMNVKQCTIQYRDGDYSNCKACNLSWRPRKSNLLPQTQSTESVDAFLSPTDGGLSVQGSSLCIDKQTSRYTTQTNKKVAQLRALLRGRQYCIGAKRKMVSCEIWRKCPKYHDYIVSNIGSVKNVITGRVIQPVICSQTKYVRVDVGSFVGLGRLVASAFMPLPSYCDSKRNIITHIDDDSSNNRLDNLKWITKLKMPQYSNYTPNRVFQTAIAQVDLHSNQYIAVYRSKTTLAQSHGRYPAKFIDQCVKGLIQSFYGYKWVRALPEVAHRYLYNRKLGFCSRMCIIDKDKFSQWPADFHQSELPSLPMLEVWKQVPHILDILISNYGRVRSSCSNQVSKYVIYGWDSRESFGFQGENYRLSPLVANTFLPKEKGNKTMYIYHIDGDPCNNIVTNLRWQTKSVTQQIKNCALVKLFQRKVVRRCPWSNIDIETYPSGRAALQLLFDGTSQQHVLGLIQCLEGVAASYGGWGWQWGEYSDELKNILQA